MSERSRRDSTIAGISDNLRKEYAEKCRLDDEVYSFLRDKGASEREELDCRFKDNCYAFRSKMGTCPCGLEE
jgi:hypothetical protein